MDILKWLLIVVVSYFLGNINGAILTSKYLMHDDVRKHGSGNAGLTNYFRTYGGFLSLLVIVVDVLKCVIACLIAQCLLPEQAFHAKITAGLVCIIGHSYPVLAGFKGGKGILCGAATAACTDWRVFAVVMTLFIVAVLMTRYVSLGSVLAASGYAVFVPMFHWGDWVACILAIVAGGFVVFRHRGNIVRLVKGTESKLTFHKK